MKPTSLIRTFVCPLGATALAALVVVISLHAQRPDALSAPVLKPRSPESSLVILPVRVAGQPTAHVSEVIGLMLQKQGLKNIELAFAAFVPPAGSPLESWPRSLQTYLQRHPVPADYVLYAEFNGPRPTECSELRAILVDWTGAAVWTDRKTAADESFAHLEFREPTALSALLVRDLALQFALSPDTTRAVSPTTLARLMDELNGLPALSERDALRQRQHAFAAAQHTARILVFPVKVGASVDTASATDLARSLSRAGVGHALAVGPKVLLPSSPTEGDADKALWELARGFHVYVKNHPAPVDFSIYAAYALDPEDGQRDSIQLIVCDAQGDWVIVDRQISPRPADSDSKPVSWSDCDRLVLQRLQHVLLHTDDSPAGESAGDG